MKVAVILICASLIVASAQSAAVEWAKGVTRHEITFKSTAINSKIVGGSSAAPGQFPWQVGVYLDGTGFCGGALISSRVILTAGHCVDAGRTFTIHVGTTDIESNIAPTQIFTTRTKILHEFYEASTLLNDVGLIFLDEDVQGQDIGTIRLPSRSQVGEAFIGETGTVSGWGRMSDSESIIAQYLQFVNLTIISNDDCQFFYGDIINDAKLCVDTDVGTAGICFGDSGGPLVIYEQDGEATEIGIASFVANEGCEAGLPDGFTRVSEYLDWIELNAGVTIRP